MSVFWSGFIIVLTLINVLGCWWLLRWTAKRPKDEPTESTTGHVWDEDLTEYNNPLPRWWLYLFYATILFALAYLALYPGLGGFAGLLGWSQPQRYAEEMAAAEAEYGALYKTLASRPIPELARDAAVLKTGQRLFANHCAICHGADARGARGFPNLANAEWLYGGDPETIRQSILDGRQGVMPPFGDALGSQGIEEVAAYVYSLNGRSAPAHLLPGGKARFEAACAACHGPEGKGNQALGAPDLTDRVWVYGGSLSAIKETLRHGRNGVMPAHRELLGEDRVHLIAAYVYSLSAPREVTHGDERP